MPGELTGGNPRRGGIWTMFAGLQLFLFVFFVYLVGTTRPDATRAESALASVRDAFGQHPLPPGPEGPFDAGASMLAELGGDLAGIIRVARVQQSGRGDELMLVVPEAELFAPLDSHPRDTAVPLLDRMVSTLSVPPAGTRLLLTLSLAKDENALDNERVLGRAAGFAAALLARGAPPDTLAVGLAPIERGSVRFGFRLTASAAAGGRAL